MLLLLALAALASPAPAAAVRPSPGFVVSISDTPSSANPLLVSFSAIVAPGNPTSLNWTFGDGTFWNGSGPAFFTPTHLYGRAGAYNVTLVVHEGIDVASQWLLVHLAFPALVVVVGATNASGRVPLTVSFSATVSGGTGTYRSFFWTFGDGGSGSGLSIRYTYLHAGTFTATLNVTDSNGTWVARGVAVQATSAADTPSSQGVTVGSLALWAAAGAGLGIAASVAVILSRSRRRRSTVTPVSVVHGTELGSPSPANGPVGPTSTALESAAPVIPSLPVSSTPPPPTAGTAPEPPTPPMTVPPPTAESLRLSQRIVLHVAAQGALSDDEVATLAFTQLGMSSALSVRQNRLTNVLRRLVAAGVLTEDVRHVRGHPRRLKVYRLAARGQALARELRRRG